MTRIRYLYNYVYNNNQFIWVKRSGGQREAHISSSYCLLQIVSVICVLSDCMCEGRTADGEVVYVCSCIVCSLFTQGRGRPNSDAPPAPTHFCSCVLLFKSIHPCPKLVHFYVIPASSSKSRQQYRIVGYILVGYLQRSHRSLSCALLSLCPAQCQQVCICTMY